MKRFFVKSITRDKEYDLTAGKKGSEVLYFSYHPNGEREVVTVQLRARPHLKKLRFDVDLGEQLIKSRSAKGNTVTKEIVSKITQKEVGGSTLAARKIWYDDVVGRLNDEQRGKFLGRFRGDDKILTLYKNGEYRLSGFDLTTHFDDDMYHIEKWHPEHAISAVYYDGEKEIHYAKRFLCEVTTDKRVPFISDSEGSHLDVATTAYEPEVKIVYNKLLKATKHLPDRFVRLDEFIDVKGMKSQGNQLEKLKTKEITLTHPAGGETPWPDDDDNDDDNNSNDNDADGDNGDDDNDGGDDQGGGNNSSGAKTSSHDDEKQSTSKKTSETAKKPKPKSLSRKRSSSNKDEPAQQVEWDLTQSKKGRRQGSSSDDHPKLFDDLE